MFEQRSFAARNAVCLFFLLLTASCGLFVDDEARMERAQAAIAAEDYQSAVIDLKTVIQNQRENAEARRLLGEASLALGDVGTAEKELERAIELGVPIDSVRIQLAQAKLRRGQGAAALEVADPQAGATDQERLQLWMLRGQAFAQMGQPEDAIASFTAADELKNGGAWPQNMIARVKVQAADFAGAEEVVTRLLERFPNNQPALTTMAETALAQQDAARAEGILAGLLEDQRIEGAQRARVLELLTDSHLAQGNIEGAQASLDELAALGLGREFQLTLFRARIALAREDYQGVTEMLNGLDPWQRGRPEVQLLLGSAYLAQGQLGLAAPFLGGALSAQPNNPEAIRLREVWRARQGLEVATGPGPLAEAGSPAAPEATKQRAALIERYTQAQRADPKATAAVTAEMEGWAQANPDDSQIRLLIAQQRLAEGRFAEARDHYEAVAAQRPEDPALLNNLAWVYHELADSRALPTARRANELLPDSPNILDTLGWVLVQNGRIDEAVPLLERAYQSSGGTAAIGYHLAVAWARAGRQHASRELTQELLEQPEVPTNLRAEIKALRDTRR